jgi:hypothetical protein
MLNLRKKAEFYFSWTANYISKLFHYPPSILSEEAREIKREKLEEERRRKRKV